ncbi:GTP-binding ADP-ribosylation factor-like protein yARL3 [Phaffia rhodozyma]|uniref:GTP-binding ADP-ribosylation factor-like protein yARL3 n=1 Tax=Phaffia rhodozyma TaxID=264483 RepID=A0A0F7SJ86_PHARH|nr:GTP-binding ADP-ribosylation factor-like protein yARL3 [Phaffia rhodozyma]
MYHLLSGLYTHLTRKETYSVIIIGLDNAGKTTLLEQIKHHYNPNTPSPDVSKIAPTVGQGVGKISLPSTILQFWDLGGQRDIRSIWSKYYEECHAVVYVVDAADEARLEEGWEVFESVLESPQTMNLPLLLLANKQDAPGSLSSTDIRESYERWSQARLQASITAASARADNETLETGADALGGGLHERQVVGLEGRAGSLEVLGASALNGTNVREVVDWLYIRVQNSRRIEDR